MRYYITETYLDSKSLEPQTNEQALEDDTTFAEYSDAFKGLIETAKKVFVHQHSKGYQVTYVRRGDVNTERWLLVQTAELNSFYLRIRLAMLRDDDTTCAQDYICVWVSGYAPEDEAISELRGLGDFSEENGYAPVDIERVRILKRQQSVFINGGIGEEHWVIRR